MRKIAALIGVLGLFGLSTALFAQSTSQFAGEEVGTEFTDEHSLLSSTTFDLFENDFDRAHEVAELAGIMGRHLWTQMGNIGGQDMFQLATVQPLWNGNIAFSLRYGKDSWSGDMTEINNESLDTDGDLVTDYTYNETVFDEWNGDFRYWNIYIGYGWNISDRVALGFGYEKTDRRTNEGWLEVDTFAEAGSTGTTYGLPNNWGNCGFDDCTNTVVYSGMYDREFDVDKDEFFFEFKYTPSDTFNVRGRLFYNSEDADDTMWSSSRWDMTHDEFSGGTSAFYWDEYEGGTMWSDYSHDGHRWGLFFDFQHVVNDLFHHDVELGWSNYSGDMNEVAFQDHYFYGYETSPFGRGDSDPEWWTEDYLWTFYDSQRNADQDHLYFRYRAYWELDNATISAGFVYNDTNTKWERSGAWTGMTDYYFNDGDGTPTGDADDFWYDFDVWGTWFRDTRHDNSSVSIPVAVIMHMTPKLDLRVGAQWTEHHTTSTENNRFFWNDSVNEFVTLGDGTIFDSSFAGVDNFEDDLANVIDVPYIGQERNTWTDVDWAIGLKYDHSDVLDFELSIFDEGDSVGVNGRDGADNTTLFASVTISWE